MTSYILIIFLKGLCHRFYQIFEQPKFIFVLHETKKVLTSIIGYGWRGWKRIAILKKLGKRFQIFSARLQKIEVYSLSIISIYK